MIQEAMRVSTENRDHVVFADGTSFHVRSGLVNSGEPNDPASDFGHDDPAFGVSDYREAVPQLQLSLTDACNMGCTYCSFRDRVHADGKPVTIPLETVRRGIRTYRDQMAVQDERYGRVDFGLAGETMLVRHIHEQVHRLVEDGLDNSPVSVLWTGPNVTNATLSLVPELADQLGPPQDISIDGPPEVHDRVRFYTNGRGGTYRDVRSVLDRVLTRHPEMGVSAVLTAYCTDFVMIFRHLYEDIGARNIYMKPVNATHDRDYALNASTLPAFERGYIELVDHILDHDDEGVLRRLLALSPEDYFMRFVYRVKDRAVQVYRCGAGKSGAYVDTNGKLYACAHFIGKSGWDIGDVDHGVDEVKRNQFLQLPVDSRDPCRGCFARYVCGGGCHYQAVLANGHIDRPDDVKCALIRTLTKLAVRLVRVLAEQRPQVLAALPTPYGIAPHLAAEHPDTPYTPMGSLIADSEARPIRLGGSGRVRAGLQAPEGISAALALGDDVLSVRLTVPHGVAGWRIWLQPLGDFFTLRDLVALGPERSGTLLKIVDERVSTLRRPDERFRRVPALPTVWDPVIDGLCTAETNGVETVVRIRIENLLNGAERLGLNLYADLTGGGWTALAIAEPFVEIPLTEVGSLSLRGPEAKNDASANSRPGLNALLPTELMPTGRWSVLQPNVC